MIHFAHAVVWLDHRAAHLFSFNRDSSDSTLVKHRDAPHHIHHRAGTMGSGHTQEDANYFREVAEALRPAREILLAGPGTVKQAFKKYLDDVVPAIASKVVGVEALDHPSDGEIVAFARKYFVRTDRMTGG
jgi:stalled ribosome rescue protein Dom34